MNWNILFDWIRTNPTVAFYTGIFVLIALSFTLGFIHDVVREIVKGIRGIPPQIVIRCSTTEENKKLRDALVKIVENDECECGCDDENCCAKQEDVFCPGCIARNVLGL